MTRAIVFILIGAFLGGVSVSRIDAGPHEAYQCR